MWPNNSFGSNGGQFPNNFNNEDEYQYPASPYGVPPGQSFFPQPRGADVNGQGYEENNFQPEVGLFNEQAFLHNNQFITANAYSPPPPLPVPQVPTPALTQRPEINARAAELKARLLKNRESRASSATPPVKQMGNSLSTKQEEVLGKSNMTQETPKAPATIAEDTEQEIDVDQLISQFSSEKKQATGVTLKQEQTSDASNTNGQNPPNGFKVLTTVTKSQAPSLGSPRNVAEPATNGKKVENGKNGKAQENGYANNGFLSDTSEGEIVEDTKPEKSATTAKPKEITSKIAKVEDSTLRKSRDTALPNPTRAVQREASPPRRAQPANPRPNSERRRDDPREEVDSRPDRRQYSQDFRNDRKPYPEPERQPRPRQDSRDEDYRRSYPSHDPPRVEASRQARDQKPLKPPALGDVLPYDDDLKEWLEITGYHNVEYRSKILDRRRKIARLDAERAQLVADMQAEERGGIPIAASSMPPPPIPNNTGGRNESASAPTPGARVDSPSDLLASNKRPHSDLQESREDFGPSKLPRVDDRQYATRKEEDEFELRRPRSNGFDTARRSSFDRRDEMDISRPRFDGRGRSRERDESPGLRAYEGRPPARVRGYEQDNYFDRHDSPERSSRGAFEVRGSYRGRAYDPNFRGRGRGRARGDTRESPEPRGETTYGSRIANGRPYRDPKGFQKGSRGDTRYFIVKSFNEENVLNCIRDSVWTTQVQNGQVFKEAFETCKNVILVFSINKSRAFQGYARMESLPGSIEAPEWQKQINWESAGAFKVRWLVVCSTRFHGVGHLKNSLNENLPVLIGKDGQEIEENCGAGLIELIDKEVRDAIAHARRSSNEHELEDFY